MEKNLLSKTLLNVAWTINSKFTEKLIMWSEFIERKEFEADIMRMLEDLESGNITATHAGVTWTIFGEEELDEDEDLW